MEENQDMNLEQQEEQQEQETKNLFTRRSVCNAAKRI